ncbi:AMP-binding protein [Paraglaciecola chathamensis]|jgi:long-chain acyl-CoA synthetase|uniref:Long-chain-fatty-acid--CoA ligase n=1 Tax=Paraglaciecola chathamensis TaxID=368405 RepID=A0A8H9IAQ4_9ALTE|nr:AMP-binding protein [Paraglaciecola oceanifecundans]GGZ64108.1 long-chain-fatty-acid--CoA ligase [Paraglaciecola oceanifecundans]
MNKNNINGSVANTLLTHFNQGCEQFSQHLAFTCNGQSTTYQDLERDSRYFATYLQTHPELKRGDRLAVQLPNCAAYPVIAWGALRAGLVVVNVNPLYTEKELLHIYRDSGAKALVLLGSSVASVMPLLAQTGLLSVVYLPNVQPDADVVKENCQPYQDALKLGSCQSFMPVALEAHDMALLQYTGGTTGLSKGAILTHQNLISAAQGFWEATNVFEPGNEIFVGPLPLYHVYAFVAHIVVGVMYGVTSILISDPRDLGGFSQALQETKFSLFVGINTLFNALCHDEGFKQLDFSGLKFTLSGGMALDLTIAKRWLALTGCEINEGYGLTESAAGVIVNRGQHDRRLGSVGKPVAGIEIKITDKEGHVLGAGEKGELHIRGKQVMRGYWQDLNASNEVLKEGWLATGDIATVDEDGFVYIVDRIKDMIIVSGFNVYPVEIEQVVNGLDGVVECAAMARKSDDTGEAVHLYVVLHDSQPTSAQILAHCRANLAAYKVPKVIKVIDQLPKSPVGKILKRLLE